MPKLPSLTSKQVIKLLEQPGFILDHTTGSHMLYYHPESKKRVTVPFHRRDIPNGTLLSIKTSRDRERGYIKINVLVSASPLKVLERMRG